LIRLDEIMKRIGSIPFDIKDDQIALLFVTSQTRGRWILPKGLAKSGETHSETCQREGFEEAGISGMVMEDFPITMPIQSKCTDLGNAVPVTYYPLLVQQQSDEWPEADKRERNWTMLNEAEEMVRWEDLQALIRQFESLAPWIKESVAQHRL
jgi:ADP-ribose pyrophosphatase YjhB (NUDIX family)